MRTGHFLAAAFVLAGLMGSFAARAQEQNARSPKILSAKTIFFDDQSGDAAVGNAALAELKKWGRYQIVTDQNNADLIVLLSIEPFHAGSAVMADGKMGVIDSNGNVVADPATTDHKKSSSSRDAYLTVIQPKRNEVLWSDSRVWGGMLTGSNSAGERLVKKLESEVGK